MRNSVAALRKARGISAVDLAARTGVTRQAIYAIEAGTYMPNTAVALRLARALESSVEDMFTLETEEAAPAEQHPFEPLDEAQPYEAGEPVQICRVGKRIIGVAPAAFPVWLPMADGIVTSAGRAALAGEPQNENRILVAGCDPALSLLAAYAREEGVEVVLANANSARSLDWLKAGRIDIAGSHLNEPNTASRAFSSVTFALWEEGFVVRRGNPKGIRKIEDLANPRVRFVNREKGSGSRRLFDSLVGTAGANDLRLRSEAIAGGHLAAAWAVASGSADCCIAARSAARRYGLDFIPLASERFELLLHKRDLARKPVEKLLDVLNRARFRRHLETLAGYDVSHAGETLA